MNILMVKGIEGDAGFNGAAKIGFIGLMMVQTLLWNIKVLMLCGT